MIRLTLLRILETYFRHRWLYLIPIVLSGVAAVAYFVLLTPKYNTHGVLYVQNESLLSSLNAIREEGFAWITPAQATAEEIRELMLSDAFVRAVITETSLEERMGSGPDMVSETVIEVRESTWTNQQGKNQVAIGATHENPRLAQELVAAVIDTYIQWRINSDIRQSTTAQDFFGDLIIDYREGLEEARGELEAYLETHPVPVRGQRPAAEELEIEKLRAEVDLAARRYASALEKRENAQLAMSETESDIRQTYYVLDAPNLPTTSNLSKRQMALDTLIFVGTGVLLSAIGIAGSALLDRSFRYPIDVEHRLNLPVVGTVPAFPMEARVREQPEQDVVEQEHNETARTPDVGNGHRELEQVKE